MTTLTQLNENIENLRSAWSLMQQMNQMMRTQSAALAASSVEPSMEAGALESQMENQENQSDSVNSITSNTASNGSQGANTKESLQGSESSNTLPLRDEADQNINSIQSEQLKSLAQQYREQIIEPMSEYEQKNATSMLLDEQNDLAEKLKLMQNTEALLKDVLSSTSQEGTELTEHIDFIQQLTQNLLPGRGQRIINEQLAGVLKDEEIDELQTQVSGSVGPLINPISHDLKFKAHANRQKEAKKLKKIKEEKELQKTIHEEQKEKELESKKSNENTSIFSFLGKSTLPLFSKASVKEQEDQELDAEPKGVLYETSKALGRHVGLMTAYLTVAYGQLSEVNFKEKMTHGLEQLSIKSSQWFDQKQANVKGYVGQWMPVGFIKDVKAKAQDIVPQSLEHTAQVLKRINEKKQDVAQQINEFSPEQKNLTKTTLGISAALIMGASLAPHGLFLMALGGLLAYKGAKTLGSDADKLDNALGQGLNKSQLALEQLAQRLRLRNQDNQLPVERMEPSLNSTDMQSVPSKENKSQWRSSGQI